MSRFRKLSHVLWHCQYHVVWTVKGRTAIRVFQKFAYLKEKPYWGKHFRVRSQRVQQVAGCGEQADLVGPGPAGAGTPADGRSSRLRPGRRAFADFSLTCWTLVGKRVDPRARAGPGIQDRS